jgi:hypothetical protein
MGDHDWLGIVLGILFAGYYYLKSKRKTQITYVIEKTQLLGRERGVFPEEVTILYKDVKITDLVKFNAIFWNSGNEPIIRQAIIERILLCFSDTSTLLKASVLKCSRPQNRVCIRSMTPRKTHVDFEYLEPRQGFNLELLITGETDDPIPTGTILRMPGGFKKFDEKNRRPIVDMYILLSYIVVFIGFFVILKVLNIKEVNNVITLIPVFLMALITAFGILWPFIFRRRGIPQDLRT